MKSKKIVIMEEYELNVDPNAMCRICLVEEPKMKTIFSNEIVDGSILPFPKVFTFVTDMKVIKINKILTKIKYPIFLG